MDEDYYHDKDDDDDDDKQVININLFFSRTFGPFFMVMSVSLLFLFQPKY